MIFSSLTQDFYLRGTSKISQAQHINCRCLKESSTNNYTT
ncbi:hypothetical protein APHCR_1356 [Anaplasma phagocytophilum str. CR1007]|nr:hypothetical protein APHCR_1356 [Anaplasma phagocytophilum str. CR1007]